MAIVRDDRWLTDAQGRALSGAAVYYCLQPATTNVIPPSPLATIYSDLAETPVTQPLVTDGFGHSIAYADNSVLYTIVFVHPLFGPNPVVLTDQNLGGGGGGTTQQPFAGVPQGTIDGTNRVFTLTNSGTPLTTPPIAGTLIVLLNGVTQLLGLGYTISGVTITYGVAPQPASGGVAADTIFAQGFFS